MNESDAPATPVRKRFNWIIVLVPVAVVAALVLAFTLPPTHALILKSPLRPLLARVGLAPAGPAIAANGKGPAVTPTTDPAAEVKRLSNELDADRKTEAAKDARISELQSEVNGLATSKAEPSPTPAPKPSPTGVSDDVKRVAAYWAGMDADKAAAIAKALPDDYVKVVFSQMPPDAVAEIMNVLPAKTAAKLAIGPADESR